MADRKGKLAIALLTAVIFVFLFLVGPRFLVAPDSLPRHVDVAVVLQGSVAGENARVAGAVALLKLGVASQLVLSVPKESFWGESDTIGQKVHTNPLRSRSGCASRILSDRC
jgi:hypothetical protein